MPEQLSFDTGGMKVKTPKQRRSDRQYLSFFSGALGLDMGFEEEGYECLSLNEVDRAACDTIKLNLKTAFRQRRKPKLYDFDIRELSADFLRDDLGLDSTNLFCVIGGPPCQAFSTAGRRLGLNDERGNVFLHFIHLIGQLRPKYAVFENVRGLLSAPLVHRPHNERGADYPALTADERPKGALRKILQVLNDYGYTVTFNLYNTANFGVPQTRERLIFFASRDGDSVPYLRPTHDEFIDGDLLPWQTIREAFVETAKQDVEASRFPEGRLRYYRLLGEGQNWKDLPEHLQQQAMGQSWYAGGGRTGFYRRLAWDRPSPTLVTVPTMPATDLCHPSELRPLSVAEYRAIQTFPTRFQFAGSLGDKYRQLGNAVPVRFSRAVASHLAAFDAGKLASSSARLRFSRYAETDDVSWIRSANTLPM